MLHKIKELIQSQFLLILLFLLITIIMFRMECYLLWEWKHWQIMLPILYSLLVQRNLILLIKNWIWLLLLQVHSILWLRETTNLLFQTLINSIIGVVEICKFKLITLTDKSMLSLIFTKKQAIEQIFINPFQ